MFGSLKRLRKRGILSINQRNVRYIGQYNDRRLYPLVDDKLKTKLLATEHNVNVPGLIGTIQYHHEARLIEHIIGGRNSFVIKPARGSGGKGILVIVDSEGDAYLRSNGSVVTLPNIRRHLSNILSGLYSLGGRQDVVIIEELIHSDPRLEPYTHEGVPDIRVIVFKGFPVMAMVRLATRQSTGRANLHQGAVGVGLDLAKGQALGGVQFNAPIETHPDTGAAIKNLFIPKWEELLELSARCFDMSNLGYLGCDFVLDKNHGPLLLELNARPGLAIQIANQSGLLNALNHIERGHAPKNLSPQQRASYAIDKLTNLF